MKKVLLLISAILCVACTSSLPPVMSYENQELKVNATDNSKHSLFISYLGQPFSKKDFKKTISLNLDEMLKSDEANRFEIAYQYAQKGSLPINIRIDNSVDTVINYSCSLSHGDSLYCYVMSGTCLKITKRSENNDSEREIKKWLYQNNKNLDTYQIWIMAKLYDCLTGSSLEEYSAGKDGIVPASAKLEGEKFSVMTNLKADKYYLLASGISISTDSLTNTESLRLTEDEIEQFISDEVANDFVNGSSNPQELTCHMVGVPRTAILLFVGINSDWSKHVIPVGVVAYDRNAPFSNMIDSEYSYLLGNGKYYANEHKRFESQKYGMSVFLPDKYPVIEGSLILTTGHFQGYGYYKIPFTATFKGDVKSVKIDGHLYDLSDKKSPYCFSHSMSLQTGDNNIEIVVTDIRGNERLFYHSITMSTIKDD